MHVCLCVIVDRVHQTKTAVKYSAGGTLVDYRQDKDMVFVPQLSCGAENDTVSVPNIPAVVCTSPF